MPNLNETWIRPILQYTKSSIFFTMIITSILTSNLLGFIAYFIGYQIASIARLIVYSIVLPTSGQNTPLTYPVFDYMDISTFITNNKIPGVLYLPLYAIAYSIAFVMYTARKKQISVPQIGIASLFMLFLICYLLTIYMASSPFTLLPYADILAGVGMGLLVAYITGLISYKALFFNEHKPRRKRLICRPV
jgi:hypothetical protein